MTERQGGGLAERLRRAVLGPYGEATARLDAKIGQLQRRLADPDALRPLVIEALRREVQDAPAALARALLPMVDEMLRARGYGGPPRRARRYWPWLTLLTATGIAGLLLLSWRGPAAMVNAATERQQVTADARAVAAIAEDHPPGIFGLRQTDLRDEDLADAVRQRLSACEQLTGAAVQFSVKDGWVWLRGQATAGGRNCAEHALADLGAGVVVVNQLAIIDPPAEVVR